MIVEINLHPLRSLHKFIFYLFADGCRPFGYALVARNKPLNVKTHIGVHVFSLDLNDMKIRALGNSFHCFFNIILLSTREEEVVISSMLADFVEDQVMKP